jgi:hypothetical protein
MQLAYQAVGHWPALAWLAKVGAGRQRIDVLHGPRVETRDNFFCEAIWDGEFERGDFDRTDRVFGSGARLRDSGIVFVSSGTTVDRLQSIRIGDEWFISNSLACLLSFVDASVDPTFARYQQFFGTILRGIDEYTRELTTTAGPVRFTYFRNLQFDGSDLVEQDKPHTVQAFSCFHDYRDYLAESARLLGSNLSGQPRRFPLRMLGTISSGYDSACVSTLARAAGLEQAISFTHGKKGRPDSGEQTARALGIELTIVDRDGWRELDCPETLFSSSDAKGEDVFFASAREHLAGCVLFTGFQGGKIWDKHTTLSGPSIQRGDRSGLSLTEYRLHAGFIHCALPFLGSRKIDELAQISRSSDMLPWDLGGDYGKPIARRILEEAGVPRDAFGREKIAASIVFHSARNMLSSSTQIEFSKWLREHARDFWRAGKIPPDLRDAMLWPTRWCARRGWGIFDRAKSLDGPLRFIPNSARAIAEWGEKERLSWYLFPWALERAKKSYPAVGAATSHDSVAKKSASTAKPVGAAA